MSGRAYSLYLLTMLLCGLLLTAFVLDVQAKRDRAAFDKGVADSARAQLLAERAEAARLRVLVQAAEVACHERVEAELVSRLHEIVVRVQDGGYH